MFSKKSGPAPTYKDAQSKKIDVKKLAKNHMKTLLNRYRGQRNQNRSATSLPNEPVECIQCGKIYSRPQFPGHKTTCPKRELIVSCEEALKPDFTYFRLYHLPIRSHHINQKLLIYQSNQQCLLRLCQNK